MSYFATVNLADRISGVPCEGPSLDAFNRMRTSIPFEEFALQNQYDASPLLMEAGATGTGVTPSYSANTRLVALSTTAGTGTCYYQSYSYNRYEAARSTLIQMSGVVGSSVAGSVVDWGYFDSANGIFFRQNDSIGNQVCITTSTSGSAVTTAINQANWNLDKLDGTGPSGYVLDITKAQLLVIDLQFLGMGRVRIGFCITGTIIWAHQFLNANTTLSLPYMQSATLPIAMLITSTSSSQTKTAYFKCAAVLSEGGGLEVPQKFSFSTGRVAMTAASGARTHVLSIQPMTTFNGIVNRARFNALAVEIINTGNNPVYYELGVGQALTAPSYNAINATYSAFNIATGATLSGNPAAVFASGFVPAATNQFSGGSVNAPVLQQFPITLNRAGAVRDLGTLTLLATGIGGSSAMNASLCYEEIR
jgi:hypothetical protein